MKLLLIPTVLGALVGSGCVMVVNYAPAASQASLYAHYQTASNMVVNQQIPVTAQMAQELTGVVGAKISGNTVQGVNQKGSVR